MNSQVNSEDVIPYNITPKKVTTNKDLANPFVTGIVLGHNHPSDNLNPSKADLDITRKIKEAGKYLDISVIDHIIVAGNSYTSLADEGLM